MQIANDPFVPVKLADGIVGVGGGTMRVLGLVKQGALINLLAYYAIVSALPTPTHSS